MEEEKKNMSKSQTHNETNWINQEPQLLTLSYLVYLVMCPSPERRLLPRQTSPAIHVIETKVITCKNSFSSLLARALSTTEVNSTPVRPHNELIAKLIY